MAGLAAADLAYLKALYSANPNKQEWRQRASLAGAVTRALVTEGDAATAP